MIIETQGISPLLTLYVSITFTTNSFSLTHSTSQKFISIIKKILYSRILWREINCWYLKITSHWWIRFVIFKFIISLGFILSLLLFIVPSSYHRPSSFVFSFKPHGIKIHCIALTFMIFFFEECIFFQNWFTVTRIVHVQHHYNAAVYFNVTLGVLTSEYQISFRCIFTQDSQFILLTHSISLNSSSAMLSVVLLLFIFSFY